MTPVCMLCVQWEEQHSGLSCEAYGAWQQANDPEHQAGGLAKHLADNGIGQLLTLTIAILHLLHASSIRMTVLMAYRMFEAKLRLGNM